MGCKIKIYSQSNQSYCSLILLTYIILDDITIADLNFLMAYQSMCVGDNPYSVFTDILVLGHPLVIMSQLHQQDILAPIVLIALAIL